MDEPPEFKPTEVPPTTSDDAANSEAVGFAEGNLDKAAAKNQAERNETYRDHIKWATLTVMWLAVLLFIIAIVSWAAHFLLPESWRWLSDAQLEKIQTVVFTGAAAGAVKNFGSKHT